MGDPLVQAAIGVSSTSSARPHPTRVQAAAAELARSGFEVLRVGRRAVSVQAEPERFVEILGIRPEPGKALVAPLHPETAGLAGLVDSLEIIPEPLSLAR